jgi:hypothetical protein
LLSVAKLEEDRLPNILRTRAHDKTQAAEQKETKKKPGFRGVSNPCERKTDVLRVGVLQQSEVAGCDGANRLEALQLSQEPR